MYFLLQNIRGDIKKKGGGLRMPQKIYKGGVLVPNSRGGEGGFGVYKFIDVLLVQ